MEKKKRGKKVPGGEKTQRGGGLLGATAFVMSYHEIVMRDGPFGWPWDCATCYFTLQSNLNKYYFLMSKVCSFGARNLS